MNEFQIKCIDCNWTFTAKTHSAVYLKGDLHSHSAKDFDHKLIIIKRENDETHFIEMM